MSNTLPDRIRAYNRDRLPGMLARKYKHMRVDVFTFFRGTCHLFYEDLPAQSPLNLAPLTWLCGDLHLENFGTFKGENRLTYFDINDFDEGLLAPAAWDLARLLTSFNLAAGLLGMPEEEIDALGIHLIETYFMTLAQGQIGSLERATATGLVKTLMRSLKSRRRSKFLDESSRFGKKGRKFKIETDRYEPVSKDERRKVKETMQALGQATGREKFFDVHDVAFRVAGTASLGLRRYAVLVEGRGSPDENFILDLKEARPSALASKLDLPQPAWASQAHRAVEIQMRMQAMPPALLAPLQMDDRWYILRELQPAQDKLNLADLDKHPEQTRSLVASLARIVAWGQLRSGGRNGSAIADELIAFGEQAALKTELLQYAQRYARQVQADYAQFCAAYDAGQME